MDKLLFGNKKVIGERLYYCTFIYAVVLSFLLASNYVPLISEKLIHRLLYIAVAALLAKIYALDGFNLKEIVGTTCVLFVAAISWRLVRNINILLYISFIFAARNVDFQKLIRLFFGTVGILLMGTILISQADIVKDFVYVRDGFHRHSLGIGYPTDTAAYVFYLLLAYYYLAFKNLTWRSYITIFLLDVGLYELTQARNSFLLILLTIPVIWVAKRASQGHLVERGVASFYWVIVPLTAYCTVFLSWLYNDNNKLFRILDHILSGRLSLSHQAIDKYGFSIFGHHIVENGWGGSKGLKNFHNPSFSYFYIDSSYVRLAVIYGLLIGILIVIFMTIIAYQSTLRREYILAAIIMMVSLHCVIEQHLIDFNYNPFILALFATLPSKKGNTLIKPGGTTRK